LESVIRSIKIRKIEAQLALCRLNGESVARESETETLTEEQRSVLARRRDDTEKQIHALQLALDLLEKQERVG
jgi:ribosomal protein L22